ncbi:MAG: nitroreductase/quinone reductase family protein, partial [Myxococcota bacterium]|nr:nitroreductase/quinone reductase family protein [Myxococcota bacterium]
GCMTAFAAFQPENLGGPTIVLSTTSADGTPRERVLSPIDDDGQLFVAANHWPRAWYHRALENLNVRVTRDGETSDYHAVPVSEQERERLLDESGFPLAAYVFTGFAPRQFLRLDPH